MDHYKKNLQALGNLRDANHKISKIENTLKKKYLRNKKESILIQDLLEDSLNKYHNIIKNLDSVIFNK